MRIIAIGGVVELFLLIVHALFPKIPNLPLAGSEIAQVGVVLGLAVIIAESLRIIRDGHVE